MIKIKGQWQRISSLLLFIFCTIFCMNACTPQQTTKTEQQQAPTAFDLAKVRQDYKGVPLKVLDISERSKDGRNALAVTLSVPLDPAKDHQSFFNVSATNTSATGGGIVDGGWVLDASGKVAWFSHTNPKSDYEVTVYQGLVAGNGAVLGSNSTAQITTRNLQPSVNFDSDGAFLVKGLHNGLPIVSVNIPEVNIDFFRIKADQYQQFFDYAGTGNYYYWNMQRILKLGELAYSGRYDLKAPINTRTKRNIDTGAIAELKQAGLYLAVMQPAGDYHNMQVVWFSVTDLGLHARQYKNRIDVHISSLTSGKPLGEVKVSLINDQSIVVKESKTTAQGLASLNSDGKNVRLIVAQTADQYSVIQMRKPALDLSAFDLGQRPQLPVELFVYTPRDLFRPGEMIDFSGLIRDGDGHKTLAAVLNGQIKRPDGSVAKHFKWQPQALGYYQYQWQIPATAVVGNWSLEVTGPLKTPISYRFKVEEFLPERMKLSFNHANKSPVVVNATKPLKVPVLGEYLYGAPAAGNRLSTLVKVSPWRSPVVSLKDYEFGDVNDKVEMKRFDLNDLTLNDKGQGQIVVNSHWQASKSPLKVRLISSLYESGGRPVTRSYAGLVWPDESLIGIRSSFGHSDEKSGPTANSRVSFDIVKANLAGELQAATNLDVKLIREDRQYFWVFNDNRGWHYDWSDKEFTEVSQILNIKAGAAAKVEMGVSYGYYRLEVSDLASKQISSIRFHAGDNWYERWQNVNQGSQAARPDKVAIALDKQHYKAGDVAKVTIVPPTSGEAIVMVEGSGPLWMQRITVAKEGTTVDIPIGADWQQHNLYVTAVVLRKGDNKQSITPKRSFGLAFLPLDRQDRQLQVTIDTPEKVLPLQTVNAQVKVTDSTGVVLNEPVYVTLAAVDVGVLSISNFATPAPFEYFFGQRRYEVTSRDIYDQVIELNDGQKARLRFGGDADLAHGGKAPQSEVQIVSLFSGLVEVNNGVAAIDLKLPDFNGRVRLMAVAFSPDQYGHNEQEMTVAAPVVTQIAMPRFIATGDKATIALDINNLSGQAQTLTVDLQSSGPVKMTAKPQTINLDDQQSQTLKFAVQATGFKGQAQFDMTLSGVESDQQAAAIKRRWKLGVRPPYPAMIEQKSQLLSQGEKFTLTQKDISQLLSQTVDARLSVSSRANLNLPEQLENLLAYPYGCLEQTSSRAFPLTYATSKQQALLGLTPLGETERLKMINKGVERVGALQRNNGGFGLWSNSSREEHWLSAFVTDFLLSARDMGIDVPTPLIDKAMGRLKQYVNRGGRFFDERYSEDKKHYTFAYKAYAAYVLSRVNQAPLGSLRTLFDRQQSHAKTGLPLVQLGLALQKMGDKKRGLQAIERGLKRHWPKPRYYGDYGTPIRDKAMIIHLLLTHQHKSNKAIELSFELVNELKGKRWLSTQERNALFLAGIALQASATDSWQAKLIIGAAQQSLSQTSIYHHRLDGKSIEQGVTIESTSSDPLYVNALVSGYGLEKPPVQADNLEIERYWYTKAGKPVQPKRVKVGELFIVQLQVSAKQRTPDALVVDLIPAGFELENQNLEHAIKLDDFRFDGKKYSQVTRYTQVEHQEYRDDRFIAALNVNRHNDANLFYLIRAVTPGTYKVPAPLVEDMYNPQRRAVGATLDEITVVER